MKNSQLLCLLFLLGAFPMADLAQKPAPQAPYPSHLPYSFGNFVWWSDGDLRVLLKKRIPGLTDDVATTNSAEGRIRDALTILLREKGVRAEVQSVEPSYSSFGASRDPEAPPPSVEFSMLRPVVLMEAINFDSAPQEVRPDLESYFKSDAGRPYSEFSDWYIRSHTKEALHEHGYLDASVTISRSVPRKDGDNYLVSLSVAIDPGQLYHVSTITAGGGPLLAGRDLSPLYGIKPGDVPGRWPLSRLTGQLREFYLHYGYADVDVENDAVLDHQHALVSYHVNVYPGPVYHLRHLTVEELASEQETRVREMLGLKPGDAFHEDALMGLNRKIADEPFLKGWDFSYSVKKDKSEGVVDVVLTFFQKDDRSSVTIQ